MRKNIVLDTNTILSAALFKKSIARQALDKAANHFQIVASEQTWKEANHTFRKERFDQYLSESLRLSFLDELKPKLIFISPTEIITDCRDPKDDKFLELAVEANASLIITGDKDLLVLNPYRGIIILKSGAFLDLDLDNF